jgi:hypothetical protein
MPACGLQRRSGRAKILDRMQAHCRRHVDIGIRVMQHVKAPQKRHRVLAAKAVICYLSRRLRRSGPSELSLGFQHGNWDPIIAWRCGEAGAASVDENL